MGRYTAAAKSALGKGYNKPGACAVYLVLEIALPSGTRRYCGTGVSSAARGGLEPRIAHWGTLPMGVDPLSHSLAEVAIAPELEDKDQNPSLRRQLVRELAKYPNLARRSAVTQRLVFGDKELVSDSDSLVTFTGILDDVPQINAQRFRLNCRTDDGPLRSTQDKRGLIPKVPLRVYFDAIDASVATYYAPLIYGVHNSDGSGSKGAVPCYLVDTVSAKYVVALGHIKTVSAVYEDGTKVASGNYTVTFETIKGATFTIIDFTTARSGQITADVEGLTVNTDGTGALITDPGVAIKHLAVNFGYGDWRSGAVWLSDGSYPIDATSFTNVGTTLTTLGYEASIHIAGDSQQRLLDVYNKFLLDHKAFSWWTNLGKLKLGHLSHIPPATIYPTDQVIEGDVDDLGAFSTPSDAQSLLREYEVKYLRMAADGQTKQSLRVADVSVAERIAGSIDMDWARASLL